MDLSSPLSTISECRFSGFSPETRMLSFVIVWGLGFRVRVRVGRVRVGEIMAKVQG